MRLLILMGICVATSLAPSVHAQTNSEVTVQQALSQARQGIYTSVLEKSINKMGDALAVSLTKINGGGVPDENSIKAYLLLINLSFGDLQHVDNPTDREPKTTLFVLRFLAQSTSNYALRAKITETQTFVQGAYSKAAAH